MTSFDPATEARRRTRRLLTQLALLLVLVVAVAFGAALLVRQLDDTGTRPASSTASRTETRGVAIPSEVVLAGVHLPISPAAGPRVVRKGLAEGFAHNAVGAAYAAIHLSLRVTPEVGPGVYQPTFEDQVVGEDVEDLKAIVEDEYLRQRDGTGIPYGQPVGEVKATARGYRVDAVDAHTAAVRLLLAGRESAMLTTFAIQLRWVAGDWALVAPPGGDWTPMVARVYAADGFTPFVVP
ncbi:hypothetical protein [Cryptosporangium aurantiacum]|uniref:DUF8175 domain-containing protein n=1 Tax=Cryptosporangium aurantiacum TaxID=134849 RepID=A0A1M7PQ72_9ACTN|nr:hypothetical protein [Cryptosporangium aurantiacum]SHN19460.1 hypothetical protein SAMN05443668_103575 [Cryptosporangium aurantiacum]